MKSSFVWVAGPSGAGKDTLLRLAQEALCADPRIYFARRLVTRPQPAWGEEYVSPEDLAALEKQGWLALSWQAHGWEYALPWSALPQDGRLVVVSVSRQTLLSLRQTLGGSTILIDADAQIRRERLLARNRESTDAISERLARQVPLGPDVVDFPISNNGAVEDALTDLLTILRNLLD